MKPKPHLWIFRLTLSSLLLFITPTFLWANAPITIGAKTFTESYLLAELAAQRLEANGFQVKQSSATGALARQALEHAQFDLYYEYTGTAYTLYHRQKDSKVMQNAPVLYDTVKQTDAKKELIWLKPLTFNNTYSLMMQAQEAKKLGLQSIDDLAAYVKKHPEALTFAVNAEFWERPDGFKKLMKAYRFFPKPSAVKKMTEGLVYIALKEGQIDVGMGYTTDGRIAAFNFINLEDNRAFFPIYNPAPVVRKAVLDRHPEIAPLLAPIAEKLDNATMQKLNYAVDIEKRTVTEVAKEWLTQQGLLTAKTVAK